MRKRRLVFIAYAACCFASDGQNRYYMANKGRKRKVKLQCGTDFKVLLQLGVSSVSTDICGGPDTESSLADPALLLANVSKPVSPVPSNPSRRRCRFRCSARRLLLDITSGSISITSMRSPGAIPTSATVSRSFSSRSRKNTRSNENKVFRCFTTCLIKENQNSDEKKRKKGTSV
jgi:hypothetical protein